MARPLRIEFPGALYHITSRGNERHEVFQDDRDRTIFLKLLTTCCNRFQWLCHAYCLMGNHYHLVIEIMDNTLSRGMRHLNGVYTQKVNWNHGKVGHLFQGRYKSVLIQRESHLLEACRYVVLNPVRAKMVKTPEEWKWSSYRGTCGIAQPAECLTTAWVLAQFADAPKAAQRQYRLFVKDGMGGESIWRDLKCQMLLGEDDFVDRFADAAKGQLGEIPRAQLPLTRPSLEQLFQSDTRWDRARRNRAIIEAIKLHRYSQKAVADHLQLHYSLVSKILAFGKSEKESG